MQLTKSQRKFIKEKVVELGSVAAVQKHYDKDCLVDKFANRYAQKKFKLVSIKRKIKRRVHSFNKTNRKNAV